MTFSKETVSPVLYFVVALYASGKSRVVPFVGDELVDDDVATANV